MVNYQDTEANRVKADTARSWHHELLPTLLVLMSVIPVDVATVPPVYAQSATEITKNDLNGLEQRSADVADVSADLEAIVDQATGVPPEFGASFLLRIAQSGKIQNTNFKLKLLRQASQFAPWLTGERAKGSSLVLNRSELDYGKARDFLEVA